MPLALAMTTRPPTPRDDRLELIKQGAKDRSRKSKKYSNSQAPAEFEAKNYKQAIVLIGRNCLR